MENGRDQRNEEVVMKRCTICRELNANKAETCSRCGHQLASLALSGWMKLAWFGFASAIFGAVVLWALSISGYPQVYPFAGLALFVGVLSILVGFLSYRFNA
jgi:hypothetical protein